jgi:predicted transposase/invertase (TIGR01784 family)
MCIADALIRTKSGIMINIEMQQRKELEMHERAFYYGAKVFIQQLEEKSDYKSLRKVINITIMDFSIDRPTNRYHFRKYLIDVDDNTQCPYGIELHFLELPKLKKNRDGSKLWDILNFFNARSEYDMKLCERNQNTTCYVNALKKLSNDEKVRMLADSEDMWQHDNASIENQARAEGEYEGRVKVARSLLTMNLPIQQIVVATGLSIEEVESFSVN